MIKIIKIKNVKNPIKSLKEKYGLNGILYVSLEIPKGLLDPLICKKNKCKITVTKTTNGRIKWNTKNRLSVELSTENPPQIQ